MPRPAYADLTVVDVARAAGVSRSTASRVLTGSPRVSPQARDRVLSAAKALGYRANPVARALATAGGHRVVLVVVGDTEDVVADDYVARALTAAAEVCGPIGLGVSLVWLPLQGSTSLLQELAADRSVAGLVIINTTASILAALPRQLRGRTVSIGIGSAHVPAVDVDNAAGATAVLEHLITSGRRRIAMIAGPSWLPCATQRASAGTQKTFWASYSMRSSSASARSSASAM